MAKKSYRKAYEVHYGIEIPNGFDIHHIDGCRDNNEISNLLMLPHELHMRYHNALNDYMRMIEGGSFDGCLTGYNQLNFTVISCLGEVLEECMKWITYKAVSDSMLSLKEVSFNG